MSKMDEARLELQEKLVVKAFEDEEFKKLLLTNPHEAIAQFGVTIPEDMEIKILEETAQTSYLILPYVADELTDEALDLVAGGCYCTGNQATNVHSIP